MLSLLDRTPLAAYDDGIVLVIPSLLQKHRNRGHTLVVTRDHIPTIYDLPATVCEPLMRAVSAAARAIKATIGCEGVTIRQNNGPGGGKTFSLEGDHAWTLRATSPPIRIRPDDNGLTPVNQDELHRSRTGPVRDEHQK